LTASAALDPALLVEDALARSLEAVERAAARGALREETLEVAGQGVRLRIAARRYAAHVDLALAHLRVGAPPAPPAGERPPLTLLVVDGAEAGGPPTLPPPGAGPGAWVIGARARAHRDPATATLGVFDEARGLGAQWIADAAALPWWAAGAPLRTLLSWALAPRRRHVVHAAAVATAAGAALLAGKGGSGKSTASLACLESGALAFLGDDYVVVDRSGGAALVDPLYASAKLAWEHLARFPALAPLVANAADRAVAEKAILRLDPALRARFARRVPLRAVLVPRVSLERDASRVIPATRGEALLALAPTTLLQVPDRGGEGLAAMRAIVEGAPAFRLLVGRDVAGIPAAIAGCLERVAAEGARA
jgi:hypothetical protein